MTRHAAAPPDLSRAWRRLGVADLEALLAAYVDAGWHSVPGAEYAVGPCPYGVGRCLGDTRAAYVYPRTDGWAPVVRCHHAGSCGAAEDMRTLLAARLGASGARAAVLHAAALSVERATRGTPPHHARELARPASDGRRRQSRVPPVPPVPPSRARACIRDPQGGVGCLTPDAQSLARSAPPSPASDPDDLAEREAIAAELFEETP